MSIYFSSDLHLGHNKDFIYEARGFKSVEEMNYEIKNRFIKTLTNKDCLFLLGDTIPNPKLVDLIQPFFQDIPCPIQMIWGNHDYPVVKKALLDIYNINEYEWGGYGGPLWVSKTKRFFLSHYPIMIDYYDPRDRFREGINLCGHRHTKNKFEDFGQYNIYHCEVDAHNCYPIKLENIIDDIIEYNKKVQ